jgi:hypothetical protein
VVGFQVINALLADLGSISKLLLGHYRLHLSPQIFYAISNGLIFIGFGDSGKFLTHGFLFSC